jgi:hypothetical protein
VESSRSRTPSTCSTAARYAELGVHRLILMPRPDLDEAGLVDYVNSAGETLIGSDAG